MGKIQGESGTIFEKEALYQAGILLRRGSAGVGWFCFHLTKLRLDFLNTRTYSITTSEVSIVSFFLTIDRRADDYPMCCVRLELGLGLKRWALPLVLNAER
jgi:hypothetical protein